MPPKSPVKSVTPAASQESQAKKSPKKAAPKAQSAATTPVAAAAPHKKSNLRAWEKSVRITSDSVLIKKREERKQKKESGVKMKQVLARGKNRNALLTITRQAKNTGHHIPFKVMCKISQEHLNDLPSGDKTKKRRMSRIAHLILRSATEHILSQRFSRANCIAGRITGKPTVGKNILQIIDYLSNEPWNTNLVQKNQKEYEAQEAEKLKQKKALEEEKKKKREKRKQEQAMMESSEL